MKRSSGVLLPIFSLPSKYGIGTLGKEAYRFVDFLSETKQSYWQILPIMETSFGNSPYSAVSSFAGNPLFIDLDLLKEDKLLIEDDYKNLDFGNDERRVNYYKLNENRYKVLRVACENYRKRHPINYLQFKNKYSFFLDNYALFHAIKDMYGGISFDRWDNKYKFHNKKDIDEFIEIHFEEIEFYKTIQCIFYDEWHKLKNYANGKGVKIIGDTPIYSAYDSAEVWATPENFCLDKDLKPTLVSGCPPDGFSAKGQLWGNPIYNYDYIKKNKYQFFIDRYNVFKDLYDVIRIDHFRGFDSYYAIPYGSPDASNGKWINGPGIELFDEINKKIKDICIVVEDLGFLTDSVRELLRKTGYPGMKVLQFGFDSRDKNNTEYLPHTYPKNSVAYIGTHDNDTFMGWINAICEDDRNYAKEYLKLENNGKDNFRAIEVLYESNSNLAIVNPQDLLGIGSEGRINTPSTISDLNWSFRLKPNEINEDVKEFLKDVTIKTNRV